MASIDAHAERTGIELGVKEFLAEFDYDRGVAVSRACWVLFAQGVGYRLVGLACLRAQTSSWWTNRAKLRAALARLRKHSAADDDDDEDEDEDEDEEDDVAKDTEMEKEKQVLKRNFRKAEATSPTRATAGSVGRRRAPRTRGNVSPSQDGEGKAYFLVGAANTAAVVDTPEKRVDVVENKATSTPAAAPVGRNSIAITVEEEDRPGVEAVFPMDDEMHRIDVYGRRVTLLEQRRAAAASDGGSPPPVRSQTYPDLSKAEFLGQASKRRHKMLARMNTFLAEFEVDDKNEQQGEGQGEERPKNWLTAFRSNIDDIYSTPLAVQKDPKSRRRTITTI